MSKLAEYNRFLITKCEFENWLGQQGMLLHRAERYVTTQGRKVCYCLSRRQGMLLQEEARYVAAMGGKVCYCTGRQGLFPGRGSKVCYCKRRQTSCSRPCMSCKLKHLWSVSQFYHANRIQRSLSSCVLLSGKIGCSGPQTSPAFIFFYSKPCQNSINF